MTKTTDLDDWPGLLPAAWRPAGLVEALREQREVQELHEASAARCGRLTKDLEALAARPTADPATLRDLALDVLAAERTATVLPPLLVLDPSYAESILASIGGWFQERPALLGSPPLVLSEVRHFLQDHAGEPTPRATDREAEVLEVFGQVAAETFTIRRAMALHSRPLDTEDIGSRVRGWASFRAQYEEHRVLVGKTRELVAEVDAERLGSDALHRCRRWGGAFCGPLLAVDAYDGLWSERWAVSLLDGLPVRPAPVPVGVA
jgi:hypothetical protein